MSKRPWPRKDDRRPGKRPPRGRFGSQSADGPAVLYGWHSVKAALENPERRIRALLTTENALRRLQEENVPLPVPPELVRPVGIVHLRKKNFNRAATAFLERLGVGVTA